MPNPLVKDPDLGPSPDNSEAKPWVLASFAAGFVLSPLDLPLVPWPSQFLRCALSPVAPSC